jgi:hypothetical protein
MTEQSRIKRPQLAFPLHRQPTDNRRCQVVGERQILELVSLGAPLPGILNKLCMMIDVRIGNVVSIISLPDQAANLCSSMTHSALQVGLEIFSSSAIFSPDGISLGVLEIFSCDQRRPTVLEYHLIDRVTYLAALALQRSEPPRTDGHADARAITLKGRVLGRPEKPPFIN